MKLKCVIINYYRTRLDDLEELIQMIRMQKLNRFLQTISIFG